MSTKHTPGPWKVDGAVIYALHKNGGEPCIATAHKTDFVPAFLTSKAERDANAKLIAAAPDLLVALKKVTAQLELVTGGHGQVHDEREAIIDARAAIAKATS